MIMSITQAELKWMKAEDMSNEGSGGGRMSDTVISPGLKNAVWPDVTQSERADGVTAYRKVFLKIADSENLALQLSKLFVENFTPAEDSVVIFPGTQTDIMSELTGNERVYGCGQLNTTVLANDITITIATEGELLDMFQTGDTIRISDKIDVDDATGSEEYATISGAVVYTGDVATFDIAVGLGSGYSSADTRVSSVIESFGDIVGVASDTSVVTTNTGAYDAITNPILAPNISSVEQTWALTFTTSVAFDVTGDVLGAVGSGNTTSDTSPTNSTYGLPYFTLLFAGFSGLFDAGDTITFTTSPASAPIWQKRVVPIGANSLTANSVVLAADGSSE